MTTTLPADARPTDGPIIHIVYTLSEKGRKISLMTGGDGRRFQYVITPATPELLKIATVHDTGSAWIYLTGVIPNDIAILGRDYGLELGKHPSPPCPRRKATIHHENFTREALLVPLDFERPGQDHLFDYDKPFLAWELLEYIGKIEFENLEALREAALLADKANKEQDTYFLEQRRIGGAKLSEWLTHPDQLGHVKNHGPAGYHLVAINGDDCYLDDIDIKVFTAEIDKRQQQRDDTRKARELSEHQAFVEERNSWIANNGSVRLKKALQAGLLDTLTSVVEEERIKHTLGPEWIIVRRLLDFGTNDILNPHETHIDELLKLQAAWPKCNVRLCSTRGHFAGLPLLTGAPPS